MPEPLERYRLWTTHPCFDEATRAELAPLSAPEIEDRFYRDLTFGTGGLRGLIGAGTNRINRYVVRQVTRGLAAYIGSFGPDSAARGVVIAHDSRRCSPEFAREAALVLAAAGVRAYLWESLRPTPMLSFAVRELQATAGIVITASHNPPEYNGYKVYWSDGGQVPPERAAAIAAQMAATDLTAVPVADLAEARAAGLVQPVPGDVDRAYLDRLLGLVGEPWNGGVAGAADAGAGLPGAGAGLLGAGAGPSGPDRKGCKVLYTALHGSGGLPVQQLLREAGFGLSVVRQQAVPDPDFATVRTPNPEDPSVFRLALQQAETEEPDLILATDPDADRLGVMVRDASGAYRLLTGNQIGALLTEFLLNRAQAAGHLPANGAVLKSIATANLAIPVCRAYGVTLIETHTGFKFIGDKIREWEETGEHTFLFGFEESYGYLAGTFVRDKDAVMAALLVAEAAAWHKRHGRTLCDALEQLWQQHGHYREALHSLTLPGKDGLARMGALMNDLRAHPPDRFGPLAVESVDDYATGALPLGPADVLHYRTARGEFVMVRPSGTEPKLKLYVAVVGDTAAAAEQRLQAVAAAALARLDRGR